MKGIRYELHHNLSTSAEYDESACDLEEGDNPADYRGTVSDILEHVTNNRWLVISDDDCIQQ